jgi:hypothetical protein
MKYKNFDFMNYKEIGNNPKSSHNYTIVMTIYITSQLNQINKAQVKHSIICTLNFVLGQMEILTITTRLSCIFLFSICSITLIPSIKHINGQITYNIVEPPTITVGWFNSSMEMRACKPTCASSFLNLNISNCVPS